MEDFAETFAIWLNPHVDWRSDYKRWPALAKLEYVDELMREIVGTDRPRPIKSEVEPLSDLRRTLAEHYAEKQKYFAWDWPANYDQELRRIFSDEPQHAGAPQPRDFCGGCVRTFAPALRTEPEYMPIRWTNCFGR